MIIGYCILIHLGICNLWCRTRMRPARLVSYSVLYTTKELINRCKNYDLHDINHFHVARDVTFSDLWQTSTNCPDHVFFQISTMILGCQYKEKKIILKVNHVSPFDQILILSRARQRQCGIKNANSSSN